MKNLFKILFYLCLINFISCKEENINPEFQKYVDLFISEASKRGKIVNAQFLKVNFNPNSSQSSLCNNAGHQILINKTVWNKIDDIEKEKMIFHEMGHCILGLNHNNCILGDGSSESIMCAIGDSCFSDYCFANFGGTRRDYYLNQLFGNLNEKPFWSNLNVNNLPPYYKPYSIVENFNSKNNLYILNKDSLISSNGETKSLGNNLKVYKGWSDNLDKNFVHEFKFKLNKGKGNLISIILQPTSTDQKYINNFNFSFWGDDKKFLSIAINSLSGYKTDINDKFFLDSLNLFKILKLNNYFYFFLNDQLLYIQDFIKTKYKITTSNPIKGGDFAIQTFGQIVLGDLTISEVNY